MNIAYRSMKVIGLSLFVTATSSFAEDVRFDRDIRPILANKCYPCHGPDAAQRQANLRLDLELEAKKSVIVPGKPEKSELLRRITSTDPDVRMPHKSSDEPALSQDEIDIIQEWIAQGAPWAEHWSFVTPTSPALPEVSDPTWPRNAIDHFTLPRMSEAGLRPSPEAPRETLLRRLSIDLTGLPPTLETLDAFLADTAPDAYERQIDRLLAMPEYGEHMAVNWLDGARYADTNGFQNDFKRMMWPWRDWVIDAYNANMPFDQFTIEQIAGDMLPEARDSQVIATGFNRNNRSNTEGGSIEDEWRVENIVDRIETTSTVFLGLSMGCARCHDHKYDPIAQREFYEFFAFFNHTEENGFYSEARGNTGPTVSLPSLENQLKLASFNREIGAVKKRIDTLNDKKDIDFETWIKARPVETATLSVNPAYQHPMNGAFHSNVENMTLEEFLSGTPSPSEPSTSAVFDPPPFVEFDRDKPFTVTLWVRPEAAGALFSKMTDDTKFRGVDALVTSDGEVVVHLANEWSENAIKVTSAKRLKMGVWSHVAVTYDGSSKSKGLRVYVSGETTTTRSNKDTLTESISTDALFLIGKLPSKDRLKGDLADFRFYNSALELPAIQTIMSEVYRDLDLESATDKIHEALDSHVQLIQANRISNQEDELKKIERRRGEYRKKFVPSVMVMRERETPRETYMLKRGAYDAPIKDELLQPSVPGFLPDLPEGAPQTRLGLAQWLVDPTNPLTARVAVNRIWHQIFGRGLVRTLEDFGVQGSPPTHPQLLDWLATEFVSSGWDVKALQKRIVMSATYRQSSMLTEELRSMDPENILLARSPRYRMSAEVVRDNALAIGGLLSKTIGGPPVMAYQPDGLWDELAGGASQGPYKLAIGEDLYRRSVYTYRKRTVPPPSMTTFDSPSWEICRVRRSRTNTPLQALELLNDITYVEAARQLALRMGKETKLDDKGRMTFAFRTATGRQPKPDELRTLLRGYKTYLETYRAAPEAASQLLAHGQETIVSELPEPQLAAYMQIASVILNLDETITRE